MVRGGAVSRRSGRLLAAIAALAVGSAYTTTGGQVSTVTAATGGDPVIAAARDIACPPGAAKTSIKCQQTATGNLLTSIGPSVVLPLGDTQYDSATRSEYSGSYDKTQWGAFKSVSRPVPGNHEYWTSGASGYYGYFGSNAGSSSKGYYSYDITGPNGAFKWHLIALNSECAFVSGGCGTGSAQEKWLKSDLAAHPGVCTLAYWHRPRFSSSTSSPSSTTFTPFWTDLYNAGADLVLNGHAHGYERFSPQTPSGALSTSKGLREFVVGSGGEDFHPFGDTAPHSAKRNNNSFGVLKLTLHADSYNWQFVPASGYSFTDSGSATCHNASSPK